MCVKCVDKVRKYIQHYIHVHMLYSMFVCSKCVFRKRFSSCFFKDLHMTFSVFIKDVTSFPCILLALQNTRFLLSPFTTILCTEEIVCTRSPLLTNVELDRLVMSSADLYHEMLAGGMQYDVVHVRLICCPVITVIGVVITDKLTSCTGTIRFIRTHEQKHSISHIYILTRHTYGYRFTFNFNFPLPRKNELLSSKKFHFRVFHIVIKHTYHKRRNVSYLLVSELCFSEMEHQLYHLNEEKRVLRLFVESHQSTKILSW